MNPYLNHIIYAQIGNEIATRPCDRLVNVICDALRQGAHGCFGGGVGRIGKSAQIRFLCSKSEAWTSKVGGGLVHNHFVSPGPRSTSASKIMLAHAFNIRTLTKDPVEQVADLVASRCAHAKTTRLFVFFDHAHNLSHNDFHVLVYLDHLLTKRGILAFLIFVQQSDSDAGASQLSLTTYPSDITGRYCITSYHRMTGLEGLGDIEHALMNFGRFRQSPESLSYQETFASSAVAKGWELHQEAELISSVVGEVRKRNNLADNGDWPMKTFVATARYLLTEVAVKNPAFSGFTDTDVRNALFASGYLALERVHGGHDAPNADGR